MKFELDKTVIPDTNIDYQKLSDAVMRLTLVNRGLEILIKDKRQKFLNQNYFHFPQGVFYLFESYKKDILGKVDFEINFDGVIGGHLAQIALGFRSDWYPEPCILNFANDRPFEFTDIVTEAILDAFVLAGKEYIKVHNLQYLKIQRKKFLKEMILFSAIRSELIDSRGNFTNDSDGLKFRKQLKTLMHELIIKKLMSNKALAESLLSRFDTRDIVERLLLKIHDKK